MFLYGGRSDNPLPPLTGHQHESSRVTGRALRLLVLGLKGAGVTLEASADDVERVEGRDGGEAGGRSGGGVLPGPRLPGRRRGSRRHLRREVVASLWGLAAARIFLGTLALTTTRELSLLGWAGLGLLPFTNV